MHRKSGITISLVIKFGNHNNKAGHAAILIENEVCIFHNAELIVIYSKYSYN